jgi:hypothetical protein
MCHFQKSHFPSQLYECVCVLYCRLYIASEPTPYFQYCLCADSLIRPVQISAKILYWILLFHMHTWFTCKLHYKYKKKDWEIKKYLYIITCK